MKTLRVLFDGDDLIYNHGLWMLLVDIFTRQMGITLKQLKTSSCSSVVHLADIYICCHTYGMERICRPELKLRKQGGLLIVLNKGRRFSSSEKNMPCQYNGVFLRETDTVPEIREKILQVWHHRLKVKESVCKACVPILLTGFEENIVRILSQGGQPPRFVGGQEELGPKMVSAHKRSIMRKFSLNSNAELLLFASMYMKYAHLHVTEQSLGPQRRKRRGSLSLRSSTFSSDYSLQVPFLSQMSDMDSPKKPIALNKENVMVALLHLCSTALQDMPPENWPSTWHVARMCTASVKVTRYWLLLLEKDGRVKKYTGPQGEMSHWSPNSAKSTC